MKPGIATALLFLLAVPYQTFWQDYEIARRGLLALLVGVLCLFPGSMPRRVPALVWPINLLALWALARSIAVPNTGYALEAACHYLALAALVIFGSGLTMHQVLRATIPTAIAVALVGIAQGFGWTLVPDTTEAVSTLGNRNVASEVLALCGAAAALLACDEQSSARDRRAGTAALLLCAVAIVLNGSRSGMLALPVGCLPCLLHGRRWLVLATVAAGMVAGFSKNWLLPLEPTDDAATSAAAAAVGPTPEAAASFTPSTIDVRLALWQGGAEMFWDKLLVGHGGGQFPTEYPRYRLTEEIELSSFGRSFETAPATVHNDYLQVAIDLGLLGFLLAAASVYIVLRVTPIRFWGPLVAFLMLAGVRAPLGNAPAIALVALFAGAMLRRQHAPPAKEMSFAPRRQFVKGLVFGLMMVWFGAGQFFSQMATTGYVERMRTKTDWPGALQSIEQALLFRPHDHNMRLERAKDRLKRRETLPDARRDIEYLLHIAPALPEVRIQHALLLNAEGNVEEAMKVLNLLRLDDPEHQRAMQISVLILVRHRKVRDAVQVLYRSRHPRTRRLLARTLAGLAGEAKNGADAQYLRAEAAFVETLDEMASNPGGKAAMNAVKKFGNIQSKLGTSSKDMRFFALLAAISLAQGNRGQAVLIAGPARGRSISPTHRKLMGTVLDDLEQVPEWRALLAGN